MDKIDTLYQQAVDKKANELLSSSTIDIISYPCYGDFTTLINSELVAGGFWHYDYGKGLHHIYFQINRKLWFLAYRKYLSGVKIDSTGSASLLSGEEIAVYD